MPWPRAGSSRASHRREPVAPRRDLLGQNVEGGSCAACDEGVQDVHHLQQHPPKARRQPSRKVKYRGGVGRREKCTIIYYYLASGVGTPILLPVTLPCSTCVAALAERMLDSESIVVRINNSRCFCWSVMNSTNAPGLSIGGNDTRTFILH